MKLNRKPLFFIVGILILATLGIYWGTMGNVDPTEKYFTVEVEQGDIRRRVSSTGTLQAVVTVQVGSQVSGRIQELNADFNSVVKKGQSLAVIDPANFEAQRDRAAASLTTSEAAVKNAEANLINRKAELESAQANLEVAQVNNQEASRQLKRSKELFEDGLIPERALETAQASHDQEKARVRSAKAHISQVKASIRSAAAQLEQSKANVKQAKAELRLAQVNLRYTNIISPIDGVVIERNVDIGQTVAASFQAPILFLIANDLSKMQVIAQIDEADIGAISEMAGVDFSVDAFPRQTFRGAISEIRLSSKLPGSSNSTAQATAANVVVYNVMIDVDNPQLKLRPAMTANVNFTVASAEDVLKVANVALRYQPSDKGPEEIREILSKNTPHRDSLKPAPPRRLAVKDHTTAQSQMDQEGMRAMSARPRHFRKRSSRIESGRPSNDGTMTIISTTSSARFGINPGLKISFPQNEKTKPRPGLLWVLDSEGKPEPRRVRFGITDGRETAVLKGNLQVGEMVISGELETQVSSSQSSSPFGGLFGRRRPPQRSRQGGSGNNRRGGGR